MERTSLALAIIAEARTLGTSIKNRITSYRAGLETFRTVSLNLDHLAKHIAAKKNRLSRLLDAAPTGISDVICDTSAEVRGILKDSHQTMETSFSKVFSTSGSSPMGKLKSAHSEQHLCAARWVIWIHRWRMDRRSSYMSSLCC